MTKKEIGEKYIVIIKIKGDQVQLQQTTIIKDGESYAVVTLKEGENVELGFKEIIQQIKHQIEERQEAPVDKLTDEKWNHREGFVEGLIEALKIIRTN